MTCLAQVLCGDNTDWLGILRPIKAALQAHKVAKDSRCQATTAMLRTQTALVIGAGGAAMGGLYAMQQLGLKVRTRIPFVACLDHVIECLSRLRDQSSQVGRTTN